VPAANLFKFAYIGKTVIFTFDLAGTTIGGTPNTQLLINTTGTGLPPMGQASCLGFFWLQNPSGAIGLFSFGSSTSISLFHDLTQGTVWTAGAGVRVNGTIIYSSF
jgi:hypothetical protein